jgi:hypothetical protein
MGFNADERNFTDRNAPVVSHSTINTLVETKITSFPHTLASGKQFFFCCAAHLGSNKRRFRSHLSAVKS